MAPLVVPVLAVLLAAVSQLAIGSRDATPFTRIAIFLVLSLQIGGAPYLLFLAGALLWCRGKGAAEIRRLTFIAPILFALVFLVMWVPFMLFIDRTDRDLESAFMSGGYFALICVALGYTYVVIVHLGYAALEKRGKIGPIGEGTKAT